MIPKDVVICDWHYERPDATAVLFAAKGLDNAHLSVAKYRKCAGQEKLTRSLIAGAGNKMGSRYPGMLQTVWGSAASFMKSYRGRSEAERR